MLTAATSRLAFSRYLTAGEEKTLFGHIGQFADVLARRDHAWMRLLRQTGVRVTSLVLLNLSDAREALATGRLRIRAETAKGGRGYDVPLNKRARVALSDLIKLRREMGGNAAPDEPLLLCRRGQRLSVRSLQARMREWKTAAGLPIAASPHWLRHTFAKRIMERSEAADPVGIVQIALGHCSRNSTGIYTLPDREQVLQALEAAA